MTSFSQISLSLSLSLSHFAISFPCETFVLTTLPDRPTVSPQHKWRFLYKHSLNCSRARQ